MVTMSGNRPVDDVGKPYIIHVILSAAKDLTRRTPRSFAALRACPERSEGMTCRTQLEAPLDRGEGYITASVVDPFGNILAIMYNPHYLEVLDSIKKA